MLLKKSASALKLKQQSKLKKAKVCVCVRECADSGVISFLISTRSLTSTLAPFFFFFFFHSTHHNLLPIQSPVKEEELPSVATFLFLN